MEPRASQYGRRFRRNKGALVGLLLVVGVTVVAAAGPLVVPHDPAAQYTDALLTETGVPRGPGEVDGFWLGGDPIGRDELARLLDGGRISLEVALGATSLAVVLGLAFGLLAGFFGGLVDTLAMRLVDILQSLPFLLVAIAVHRVLDSPRLWALCLLLGLLSWTTLARVTRTKTQQVRELAFVEAARALGMSASRRLLVHVLPNVLGPAIVLGTTLVAQMILIESSMSFLGLGVRPPQASWGSMLREGQDLLVHAPRLVLVPGALVLASVFGFNLLGEGLRDALDPKA